MKFASVLLLLTLAFLQESFAFTTVKPLRTSNPLLWKLEYERDEYNEGLYEEWQQAHGPRFHQRILTKEDLITPNDFDEGLALRFPEVQVAQEGATDESSHVSSYQGLANPTKAGLVLSIVVTATMLASSDLASSVDLHVPGALSVDVIYAYLDAGVFAMATVMQAAIESSTAMMQEAQMNWVSMYDHLSAMETSIMNDAQVWSQVMMAQMDVFKESAAMTLQSSLGAASDSFSQMHTLVTAEAENWNHVMMAQMDASKESAATTLQSSLGAASDSLSQMHTIVSTEAEKWNQVMLAQMVASKASMTVAAQSAQADFAAMADSLSLDFQAANGAFLDQLQFIQQTATTSMEHVESDLSQVQASVTATMQGAQSDFVDATDNLSQVSSGWMQTLQSSTSSMMQQVQVAYSGVTNSFENFYARDIQQAYHGFMDSTSSILVQVSSFVPSDIQEVFHKSHTI